MKWMAGILSETLLARSVLIPNMLSIRNIALTTEADELYPRATEDGAFGGVVC